MNIKALSNSIESLSLRRAWIEMYVSDYVFAYCRVALLTESVD